MVELDLLLLLCIKEFNSKDLRKIKIRVVETGFIINLPSLAKTFESSSSVSPKENFISEFDQIDEFDP
jgi:hypothetical protein